jgi:hypothetical protein
MSTHHNAGAHVLDERATPTRTIGTTALEEPAA